MTMKYHHFLKDALEIHGQNNLVEYMMNYCIDFFQKWMSVYSPEPVLPDDLRYAVTFSASGAMYLKFLWIANGIDRPMLNVTKDIIDSLNRSLTPIFFQESKDNPFEKAAIKIREIIEANQK